MASRGLFLQRALASVLVLVGVPLLLALPGFFQDAPIQQGEISPRTVIAPEQVRVADPETTERQRREAADAVAPVLVADTTAQREIVQRVEDAFAAVRAAREPDADGEVPRPTDQIEALMERLDRLDGQGIELLVSLSRTQLEETEREALDIARTLARGEFTAEELVAIAEGPLQTELAVRTFPQGVATLVVDPLLRDALRPTVQVDEAATEQRREQAAAEIADVVVTFQRDNAIVRAGDIVSQVQFAALRDLDLEGAAAQDELVKTALLALLLVVASGVFLRATRPRVVASGSRVLLLAVLLTLFTALLVAIRLVDFGGDARYLLIPAAAFTMLGTILFDTRVGALLIVPITALTAYVAPADGVAVPFVAVSGLVCIPLVHRLAARGQLRRAAWQSTLAIVIVAGLCQVVFGDLGELVPALLAGLGNAVLVTVIVNGALPFLESVFGVLTATSLLDLADRNHPLLRELEQQALGSYNHSIMVSTLVERASRAVGANALLASVCALYHDIGKVARPYFFVENQFGITNPHDELDNPRQSAMIIKRHVTDGLDMAAVHRLPVEVVDGIRTHHGTTLVSFFYRKALQESTAQGEVAPEEEHFRYPGVKPFTRELAILMLADCCESASRAAAQHDRNLTRAALEAIVRTLIAERVEDGQLDDSPLTFADLQAVEHSFVDTLVGVYHPRIAYPDDPRRRARELADQARRDLAEAELPPVDPDDGGILQLPAFLDPDREPPAAPSPSPKPASPAPALRPSDEPVAPLPTRPAGRPDRR